MLASFRSVFHPTEEEIKRKQEFLMKLKNKGIAERACSFCKHSQVLVFAHGECDYRCRKTEEDVTFAKGRDCFEGEE